MSHDNRKKGCPNEYCDMYKKKKRMSANFNHCPICGMELVFVCPKCFNKIKDEGPKHRYCALCEAKHTPKPRPLKVAGNAIHQLGRAGEKAGNKIRNVGGQVGNRVREAGEDIKDALDANDVQETLLNTGARVAKEVGTVAIKEAGTIAKRAVRRASK